MVLFSAFSLAFSPLVMHTPSVVSSECFRCSQQILYSGWLEYTFVQLHVSSVEYAVHIFWPFFLMDLYISRAFILHGSLFFFVTMPFYPCLLNSSLYTHSEHYVVFLGILAIRVWFLDMHDLMLLRYIYICLLIYVYIYILKS